MRKNFLYILLPMAAFSANAITIDCTPGNLSSLVSDKAIESLEITGTINALDFKYIADSLTSLKSLDMSKCTIEAYQAEKPVFANARSFAANEIPAASLAGSGISSISLPESATAIGNSAFLSCSDIESITLPASLDSIADFAFSSCQKLKDINIPASVKHIGEGAFSHCKSLGTITIANTSRTESISIGAQAFIDCSALTQVNLGKWVKSIGEKAFSGCSNPELKINIDAESQLCQLGEGAFMGSGISSFDFANCPNLKVIPQYAFATSSLKQVAIPATVEHIGEGAFFYGTSITAIDLGNCASNISDLQFAGCTAAQNTGITDDTNEIGNYAYYGWTQTNKLQLPENVAHIGDQAFAANTAMTKITSTNAEAPELGKDVFLGVTPADVLLTTRPKSTGYTTAEQWKDFKHTLNGDADQNAEINVNDITTILSQINGKTPVKYLFEAADANVDNTVNDTDVNTVVDIIFTDQNKE